MRKKIFLPVLFLIIWFGYGFAQEVIANGGNCLQGFGLSLSCTVGEVVIETVENSPNMLTQGFHQSNLSVTAIDDILYSGVKLSVYPNPASDYLTLKISEERKALYCYRLFDQSGKILLYKLADNSEEQIDMQPFVSGNYILHISRQNGDPVQSFKVIKR